MPVSFPAFEWRGIAWALLAALCFAVMGIVIKDAHRLFAFSASEMVFWRTFFAVLVLGAAALVQRKRFASPYWRRHLGRSVAGTVSLLLYFQAMTLLPLATAVTLGNTASIFLALLSFLILRERVAPLTWFALFLGLGGVAILLQPAFASGQAAGMMCALGSASLAGLAYLQVREMTKLGEPPWRIVFYFALLCMATSGAISVMQGWQWPALRSLPWLLGIGATALVAQVALTRAYALGPKFAVSAMSYVSVAFSFLLAWQLLGETLRWYEVLGMVVIVAAGILSVMPEKKRL